MYRQVTLRKTNSVITVDFYHGEFGDYALIVHNYQIGSTYQVSSSFAEIIIQEHINIGYKVTNDGASY